MKIDGRQIAGEIIERVLTNAKHSGSRKFFAVFYVGNDKSTESFLNQKEKTAKQMLVDFRRYHFLSSISQDELRKEIYKITKHSNCGGAIVQLPLPEHIDFQYVMNVIPREKDADVLGERSIGAFSAGRNSVIPPAAGVCEEICLRHNINIEKSVVLIIGRGSLVGKPVAIWLLNRAKELIVLGRESDKSILKDADIVICGAGAPKIVSPEMLKNGACVIDFGYGEKDGKMHGDFDSTDEATIEQKNIIFTPTPGGTGPILVAKVFENFFNLIELQK